MISLSFAVAQSDGAIASDLRASFEIYGYTISWYSDLQSPSSVRLMERGILESAAIVVVWSAKTERDKWVEQQLIFAQKMKKPLFVVILNATVLSSIFMYFAAIPWQGSAMKTLETLLMLPDFPVSQSTDLFRQLYEDQIVLSEEPLAESESLVTLDIVSETETWRGPLMQKRILEGKITMDPQNVGIYALSTLVEMGERLSPARERAAWDFYLLDIPFTLHQASANNIYREVTFFVSLDKGGAIAFDLLSPGRATHINETIYYTVSPDMKFELSKKPFKLPTRSIRFKITDSFVTAFGEGEQRFYWIYKGNKEQKEVIPGTRHALFVLRAPHGMQIIDGIINYEVVVAKYWRHVWDMKDSRVDPYPLRWKLGETVPPFFPKQKGQIVHVKKPLCIDVCILCALAEEVEGLKESFQEELGVTFHREYNDRLRRTYDCTAISNIEGETLGILVIGLPRFGSLETGLLLQSLLEEFKPRFAAMTGICAGDRKQVNLGDIIVAERAFLYDAGKIVFDKDRQQKFLHDVLTWYPSSEVVQFVRGFRSWEQVVTSEPRPLSMQQQRDWLLYKLFELRSSLNEDNPKIDAIAIQERETNAPQWRKIVWELQKGSDPYLTSDRRLKDYMAISHLCYGKEEFPYKDPARPAVSIVPIASGNAVRSDDPFAAIKEPVRGTVAIDMEGAAFYRTLADFPDIHCLLVKGISDYVDESKDDSYHQYASKISARYLLSFVREYVTSRRLPVCNE